MYCVGNLFLILCTITLIKAVGLKIDGLLNFGDSWSYEYRIQRSGANDSPHQRAEESAQDRNDAIAPQRDEGTTTQKDFQAIFDKEREIAYQRDEETARNIDKVIAEQREAEVAHHIDKIIRQNQYKNSEQIQEELDHLRLAEKILRQEAKRLRLEAHNAKKGQRQGPVQDYQLHYIHNPKIPQSEVSSKSSSKSDESKERDDSEIGTTIMNYETTKKSNKMLRDLRDSSNTYSSESRESESRYSLETSANSHYKHKTRQGADGLDADASPSHQTFTQNITSKSNETTPKSVKQLIKESMTEKSVKQLIKESMTEKSVKQLIKESMTENSVKQLIKEIMTEKSVKQPIINNMTEITNNTMLQNANNTEDPKTTTEVTTVRTGDIFTDTHQVKNDSKISEFTNHLYKQTLKIFNTIKDKTDQEHIKEQIDSLAKSYQDKFKEFVKDTSHQKIKTRLGTQKVVLNTIDTSFRLLRRLMNFMVNSLDHKGTLRHNAGTVSRFQKAIDTEEKLQSIRACKKFSICRIGPGFSAFLADILDILLKCDETKFKKSMDAFTEVVKNLQLDDVLEPDAAKILKVVINRMEKENVIFLRAMVMVLKNTITSQNKPMIVNNYAARSNVVNSTLALLEIIDLLDTKIPRTEANHLEWADMKKSLGAFAKGTRQDVQDIMEALFIHVVKNLKALDAVSKKIVSKNLAMILSLVVGKS